MRVRLLDLLEMKLVSNMGKVDMDVMKVHRMKFLKRKKAYPTYIIL